MFKSIFFRRCGARGLDVFGSGEFNCNLPEGHDEGSRAPAHMRLDLSRSDRRLVRDVVRESQAVSR